MNRPVLVAVAATILLAGCGAEGRQDPVQTSTVEATIPESETIVPAPSPTATGGPTPRPADRITDPAY